MKRIYKWIIGVVSVISLGILTNIIDRSYFGNTTVSSVWGGVGKIFSNVWSFISIEIPVWYSLLIIALVVIGFILDKRGYFKPKPVPVSTSDYHNYTEDVFGIDQNLWGWYWVEDEVQGLSPACPNCGRPTQINPFHLNKMISSNHDTYFDCSSCRLAGRKSDFFVRQDVKDVNLEIYDRIANRKYLEAIKNYSTK